MATLTLSARAAVATSALILIGGCLPDAEPLGGDEQNGGEPTDVSGFRDPTPEGTGPEPPRNPGQARPSVVIAGPPIGRMDEAAKFSVDEPTQCVRLALLERFDEAALVTGVAVGPANGFKREDSNCQSGEPICAGFTFLASSTPEDVCVVGVTWSPESAESRGWITLDFRATCRTNTTRFCDELDAPLPPDGTPVTFANSVELAADLRVDLDPGDQDGEPGGDEAPGNDGSGDTSEENGGDDSGDIDEDDGGDSGDGT